MRGTYRGNDNTLRWAIVGGIVVVVVIATILAISSALGGSSPKSSPPPNKNNGNGSACLYPAKVQVQSALLTAPTPKSVPATVNTKAQLKAAMLVARNHSKLQAVAISRTGKHFLFINKKRRLIVGTPGGQAKALHVHAVDFSFSGNGKHIIYQKTVLKGHSCASLVLMSSSVNGKHKHLLLASGSFRLANDDGAAAAEGVLQGDVLPSGLIILVRDEKLYGFNPTTHKIGPLESISLGSLFNTGGTVTTPSIQFSVSPTGQYALTGGKLNTPLQVYNLPAWTLKATPASGSSISQFAWSRDGQKLAYPARNGGSISIVDMGTGTTRTITLPQKFHSLTLSNLRWSADGSFIGFTGASLSSLSQRPKAYIISATAKNPKPHRIKAVATTSVG